MGIIGNATEHSVAGTCFGQLSGLTVEAAVAAGSCPGLACAEHEAEQLMDFDILLWDDLFSTDGTTSHFEPQETR